MSIAPAQVRPCDHMSQRVGVPLVPQRVLASSEAGEDRNKLWLARVDIYTLRHSCAWIKTTYCFLFSGITRHSPGRGAKKSHWTPIFSMPLDQIRLLVLDQNMPSRRFTQCARWVAHCEDRNRGIVSARYSRICAFSVGREDRNIAGPMGFVLQPLCIFALLAARGLEQALAWPCNTHSFVAS